MGSTFSRGASISFIVDDINSSPETLWSTVTDIESMPKFISTIKEVEILGSKNNAGEIIRHGKDDTFGRTTGSSNSTSRSTCHEQSNCHETICEGFAWEETRIGFRRSKLLKCVTSMGCDTIIINDERTSDTITGLPGNVIRHQRKHLRINATVRGRSQMILWHRNDTKTYTIFVDWDEAIDPNLVQNDNQKEMKEPMDTSDVSVTDNVTVNSVLSSKKCQLTVTMASIPANIFVRFKLMILGSCGIIRMVKRSIQNEVNELVTEAERRERQQHQ